MELPPSSVLKQKGWASARPVPSLELCPSSSTSSRTTPLLHPSPLTMQSQLAQFSLAYMAADVLFYLVPFTPGDFMFLIHHCISAFYVLG